MRIYEEVDLYRAKLKIAIQAILMISIVCIAMMMVGIYYEIWTNTKV